MMQNLYLMFKRCNNRSSGGGSGGSAFSKFSDMLKTNPQDVLPQLSKLVEQGTLTKATFTTNGNSVKQQAVEIINGQNRIEVYFNSRYEPTQIINPSQPIKTGIYATVWENGNAVAQRTITESKTKSVKSAKKQYEDTLDIWKKATKQKSIKF